MTEVVDAPTRPRQARRARESRQPRNTDAYIVLTLGGLIMIFPFVWQLIISLSSQAEVDLKAFEDLVSDWPLVRECHMLAGEMDFLLKVVAEDWDAYQRFLTTQLTAAPNVSHVKSALAIRTSKLQPGVPVDVDGTDAA